MFVIRVRSAIVHNPRFRELIVHTRFAFIVHPVHLPPFGNEIGSIAAPKDLPCKRIPVIGSESTRGLFSGRSIDLCKKQSAAENLLGKERCIPGRQGLLR